MRRWAGSGPPTERLYLLMAADPYLTASGRQQGRGEKSGGICSIRQRGSPRTVVDNMRYYHCIHLEVTSSLSPPTATTFSQTRDMRGGKSVYGPDTRDLVMQHYSALQHTVCTFLILMNFVLSSCLSTSAAKIGLWGFWDICITAETIR